VLVAGADAPFCSGDDVRETSGWFADFKSDSFGRSNLVVAPEGAGSTPLSAS
jgi:hypothetical protein